MGNAVIHFELMSKEPEKVSAFYSKVFDWTINHVPEINYRVVETGAEGEMHGINGGIVKPDKPGPWPGDKIHVEEHKVPRMGKFSLFTDPEGRMMGLWKAKT